MNLQILRDAKVEHEEKAKMMEQYEEARKANFGALFDENNGELCTFDMWCHHYYQQSKVMKLILHKALFNGI